MRGRKWIAAPSRPDCSAEFGFADAACGRFRTRSDATTRGQVMEFLCPNGHKIHCPDEQAGRAAKCPRCGVRFRIPDLSETGDSSPAPVDSDVSRPQLTDLEAEEAQLESGGPMGQIEFLCPNGHRLHGPAGLQGRPGECPQCGSKFRVPTYDEVPEEAETGLKISLGRIEEPLGELPRGEAQRPAAQPTAAPDVCSHPLAALFSRLWAEKAPAGAIELHFGDGQTLVPDHFAKALSQQRHGVFAVKERDGTHTLTVVAWDSVQRVLVRGVETLPD